MRTLHNFKSLIKLFIVLALVVPLNLFAQEKGTIIINAPLKKTPDLNAQVFQTIEKGETVFINGSVKYYYKVTYNGIHGYISTTYIRLLNPKLDSILAKRLALHNDSVAVITKKRNDSLALVFAKLKDSLSKQAIVDQAKAEINKKRDQANYDAELTRNAAKWRKSLVTRFGKYYANKIIQGIVQIGMTRSMVKEVLGEPSDINRTVTSYSTHEQWVYSNSYSKTVYYYFENGKLTSWQD